METTVVCYLTFFVFRNLRQFPPPPALPPAAPRLALPLGEEPLRLDDPPSVLRAEVVSLTLRAARPAQLALSGVSPAFLLLTLQPGLRCVSLSGTAAHQEVPGGRISPIRF